MIKGLYFITKTFFYAGLIFIAGACGQKEEASKTLFNRVPSSQTNVDFENSLTDSDEFNIIEYLYYYNGGGVSAGDINNDGLPD